MYDEHHALSFFNLIEANVVAELRREHKVPMARVRTALEFLAKTYRGSAPARGNRARCHAEPAGVHPPRARGILLFFPRLAPPRGAEISEDDYAPIVVNPEVCFGRTRHSRHRDSHRRHRRPLSGWRQRREDGGGLRSLRRAHQSRPPIRASTQS